MSGKPYQRKQGEFELRVLKDGRVVMIAPDEALLEIGQLLQESGDPGAAVSGQDNVERSSTPADGQRPR